MAAPSIGSSCIDVDSMDKSLVVNRRAATDRKISGSKVWVSTQLTAVGTFTSTCARPENELVGVRRGEKAAGVGSLSMHIGREAMTFNVEAESNSLEDTRAPIDRAKDSALPIDSLPAASASNMRIPANSTPIGEVSLIIASAWKRTVTIANNPAAMDSLVESSATACNNLESSYKALIKHERFDGQVGALLGGTTVTSTKSRTSRIPGRQMSGTPDAAASHWLIDRDVSVQIDGTLKPDADGVNVQLAAYPHEMQELFYRDNGIAGSLRKALTGRTSISGTLALRTTNLNKRSSYLDGRHPTWIPKWMYTTRAGPRNTPRSTPSPRRRRTWGSFVERKFGSLTKEAGPAAQ